MMRTYSTLESLTLSGTKLFVKLRAALQMMMLINIPKHSWKRIIALEIPIR
jgi:hypothetical protein